MVWMVEGVGDFMEGGRERARKEEEEEEICRIKITMLIKFGFC